ncbi:Protein Y43F8C.13 [Aphelenchoides avenae]|nr:Protein Y43F8C.13 [Aphelenchus avenae]
MATRAPRNFIAQQQNQGSYKQYFFCDEITIGIVIDEERMAEKVQVRAASVELHGQKTRGQIAIDWSQRSDGVRYDNSTYGDYRPVTFLVDYNATYLNELIFDAIKHSTGSKWPTLKLA